MELAMSDKLTEAQQQLVIKNIGLSVVLVQDVCRREPRLYRLNKQDLYSAAHLGFCRAIARFDRELGCLSSYSFHYIRNEVQRLAAHQLGAVSVRYYMHKVVLPETKEKLRRALWKPADGNIAESALNDIATKEYTKKRIESELENDIDTVMSKLSKRERHILYSVANDMTIIELAREQKCTKQMISYIYIKACKKAKYWFDYMVEHGPEQTEMAKDPIWTKTIGM